MRESVVDVPPQEVITKDNVVVTVDAVVYYEATDPVKLLYNVSDFYVASTKLRADQPAKRRRRDAARRIPHEPRED